ncbi:hypothetical protein [Sphaerisporangium corydalis]|uniref:Uncharacterized protein n=1 Tax=Sphaerisporangium corydalis TaxID=1441875 RepID=A0ABV9EMW5_9ACTN|nr:hypothetical protein [Sphaerisporangium corydalis]
MPDPKTTQILNAITGIARRLGVDPTEAVHRGRILAAESEGLDGGDLVLIALAELAAERDDASPAPVFLPDDADVAMVLAHLDANPAWEHVSTRGMGTTYRRQGGASREMWITVPDAVIVEHAGRGLLDDVIRAYNAHALGLGARVDRDALARLVAITQNTAPGSPIHRLATGQGSS